MSITNDASTQLSNTITQTTTFTTNTTPEFNFNGTSGIYNPTAKTVKIFTNNTDALTIDSNQCLYGNVTRLTHLQYTNIHNKPTNFQSDWNSTIINKPIIFNLIIIQQLVIPPIYQYMQLILI